MAWAELREIQQHLAHYKALKKDDDQLKPVTVAGIIDMVKMVRNRFDIRAQLKTDLKECLDYLKEPCGNGGVYRCKVCQEYLLTAKQIVEVL